MNTLRIHRLDEDDRATIRDLVPGTRLHWHRWENQVIHNESAVMRTVALEVTRVPMPAPRKTLNLDFTQAWLFLWPDAYGLAWIAEEG